MVKPADISIVLSFDQIRQTARDFGRAVFDGDYNQAHQIVDTYIAQFGVLDSNGRQMMYEATSSSYPLAYRSTSTDREVHKMERNDRLKAWFSHAPLDMQSSLVFLECLDREFENLNFQDMSWSQWHDLLDAPDPVELYRNSPLYGRRWTKPVDTSSPVALDVELSNAAIRRQMTSVRAALASDFQSLAGECIRQGFYDKLNDLMTLARISPWESVSKVYMGYKGDSSTGHMLVKLKSAVPFWATGVLHGATDPRYWEIMKQHGGPAIPFVPGQEKIALPRRPAHDQKWKRRCAGPSNWSNPLAWLDQKESPTLMTVLGKPEYRDNIDASIAASLSAWRQWSLSSTVVARAPQARPGRM